LLSETYLVRQMVERLHFIKCYSSLTKQRHPVSYEGTMGPSAVLTQSFGWIGFVL